MSAVKTGPARRRNDFRLRLSASGAKRRPGPGEDRSKAELKHPAALTLIQITNGELTKRSPRLANDRIESVRLAVVGREIGLVHRSASSVSLGVHPLPGS
jgi:hypothetical protein